MTGGSGYKKLVVPFAKNGSINKKAGNALIFPAMGGASLPG